MTKVLIDGVVYVPQATIEHTADENVQRAVRSLVTLYTLYDNHGMSRGARGCVFEALEALAPNLAQMVVDGLAKEAYDALHPEETGV